MSKIILSTSDIASFFGVTRKTIASWKKAGCPQESRGKFDLKVVFDWWWLNLASERAAAQAGDESINEAKRQYWWGKAAETDIKVKQIRGELMPKSDIYREWSGRMAEYKSGCFGLEGALPPLLEGKNQPEMRKVICEYVWSMFDRLHRTGRFIQEVNEK